MGTTTTVAVMPDDNHMESDDRDTPDSVQIVAQRFARLTEIADAVDPSNEALLEPVKLVFGSDGVLADEDPDNISRE